MVDTDLRRSYPHNAILIESARVLASPYDDAVVYLTGAQLELLRNVTFYLNRRLTYAASYEPGYYMMPNNADFDDILAIVADLEETLMGNPNTIWGYKDRWYENVQDVKSGAGNFTLQTAVVPAGYIYRCDLITSVNVNTVLNHIHEVYAGGTGVPFATYAGVGANIWQPTFPLGFVLKEGDRMGVSFVSCLDGDTLVMRVIGTKMAVPT